MKVRDERLDQVDFNHNWLKNRYLPALYRFLNLLRDEIEDPEFGTLFLTTHFRAWEHDRGLVAECATRLNARCPRAGSSTARRWAISTRRPGVGWATCSTTPG